MKKVLYMGNWIKSVIDKIKSLNLSVESYQKDTVIQSLPTVALVNRAKKYYEDGNYLEAKLVLDKAMELPQKDARVLKYQGMVSEKLGLPRAAVDYYQDSADLNPHDKNIWQKLGFALIAVNKYVEAEKSFENADKILHGNTDTNTGWGMALMKQSRYEEAREKFLEATKINQYNFSALFLAAVMDIRLNELDKAETRLAFLANVSPNEANVYEYAHLKYIKKDYENTLFYAKKALEHNSNLLPAYLLIANVYTLKGDLNGALECFKTAEEKELISMPLYFEWGLTLEKFDYYKEAVEKFEKAKELKPEDKDVLSNLCLCKLFVGEIDEAKILMEKVPQEYATRQAKAVLLCRDNRHEEALAILKELIIEDRESPFCFFQMAKCYEKLENDVKVKECYSTAIEKRVAYFSAYREFAKYLFGRGEYADAQRKLRKALKFDENNVEILNLLFYSGYKLVKEDICEYNIKETLGFAERAVALGGFEYPEEKAELEEKLKTVQGN